MSFFREINEFWWVTFFLISFHFSSSLLNFPGRLFEKKTVLLSQWNFFDYPTTEIYLKDIQYLDGNQSKYMRSSLSYLRVHVFDTIMKSEDPKAKLIEAGFLRASDSMRVVQFKCNLLDYYRHRYEHCQRISKIE
jgi:hypothetical protein